MMQRLQLQEKWVQLQKVEVEVASELLCIKEKIAKLDAEMAVSCECVPAVVFLFVPLNLTALSLKFRSR